MDQGNKETVTSSKDNRQTKRPTKQMAPQPKAPKTKTPSKRGKKNG